MNKDFLETLKNERPSTMTQVLRNYLRAALIIERQNELIENLADMLEDADPPENLQLRNGKELRDWIREADKLIKLARNGEI